MHVYIQNKNLINSYSKFNYILLVVCIFSTLFVSSCKRKESLNSNSINPEFIGVWSSDNGCSMILNKKNNSLILEKYTDSQHNIFINLPLQLKKDGIGSKFTTQNSNYHFSGLYLEGEMIIDNYCNRPLHKIDN